MKKRLSLLIIAGMVSAASAVSLIDTDFTSPYVNGNIAGQQSWLDLPLTGEYSFEVDATAGVADTAPYAPNFDTGGSSTNGHYVYLNSSLGNEVDDEWSGTMDFTLSTTAYAGTNIALFSGSQTFFQIGLSDAVTNRPGVTMQLLQKDNEMDVTLSKSGRFRTLGRITNAEMGWNPNVPTNSPDFQTDNLRLTWTIRKTRTDETYSAVAVISNLTTGASTVFDPDLFAPDDNLNYAAFSNVYHSANVNLAMGHHSDADEDGTASLIHIALDSLSVDQTGGNVPVLDAPVLSASGGNNLVDLSWSSSLEATSYAVKRSTTSGSGYATLETLGITNAYTDATAVNDMLYYYIVTASETGAADVDSNEAVGEPQAAATGSIVDTTFIASEGYANGNLNGQTRWKDADSGASPSFAVTDATGSGFADSEPYIADFDNTIGNNIYFNRLMNNNVGDEWAGSVVFQFKTTPSDGQVIERIIELFDESGTNSIGFATNSYTVAAIGANEVLKMGLTANPSSGLEFNDANDIVVVVRHQTSGRLDFQFNETANKINMFGQLSDTDIGWDPNWRHDVASGPDFETDPITMNFTIRKPSTPVGSYTLWGEVICNGITNSSGEVHEYTESTDMFNAEFVYLAMGIDQEAGQRKALVATNGLAIDDQYEGDPMTIAIDSLSFTKADDQDPIQIIPANLLSDVADGTVVLNWDPSVEASSYTVRRYPEYTGGSPVMIIASSLTDPTYTESGLVNGTTYFYTVSADYGVYGEAETAIIAVRPLGKNDVLSWGLGGDNIDSDYKPLDYTETITNGIANRVSSGTGGAFFDASKFVNASVSPLLYGVAQGHGAADVFSQFRLDSNNPDRLQIRRQNDGFITALLYMKQADFPGGSAMDLTGGSSYSMEWTFTNLSGGGGFIAIKNGSQWYISATEILADATTSFSDLNLLTWAPITEATLTSSTVMAATGPYALQVLNNVVALGYFLDAGTATRMVSFKLSEGESATPLQLWTDGFNIYNDDAAGTTDYDLDGVNNVHEWGTLGDPTDPGNSGKSTRSLGLDGTGTNFVYIYPRLESEPRPNYTVQEKDNLIYDFTWEPADATETGAGLWNTNNPTLGLEAVTNLVPIDLNVKFIGLEITE